MTERDSSITRRQLGRYLREAREAVGLTLADAAGLMEWSRSSLQRIETGQNQKIRIRDLDGLIEIYGIDNDRAAGLRGLAQQAAEKSWWHEYGGVIPANFSVYMGLESAARTLTTYQPDLVPGLLQTGDYARVLAQVASPGDSRDERESRVQLKLRRQTLITRKRRPAHLEVVLAETVLRRMIGSPRIMATQLRHLADASTLTNVSLRILPFSAGMPAGEQIGPFVIMEFAADSHGKPVEPTIVYAENYTGDMYSEKIGIVRRYTEAYDRIQRATLDAVCSRNLLRNLAREHHR
ncbi:helix-turn-helix domain-containing protein [Nocardia carnea]|uniref:helix-turn-helix domain-containing protein n=1 Tax=Nocardia carnea TaxID=37328 RepID=UPI002455F958|nr:helix-turn-helix transcriptional regulator [Nocardia carnea]